MNKWDKLNKEFDAILENLTHEDWVIWDQDKSKKAEERKQRLVRQGIIQANRIAFQADADFVFRRKYTFHDPGSISSGLVKNNKTPNVVESFFLCKLAS